MPKILAIDDKEDNLISLSALLRAMLPECTVITARSGMEGIEKAKKDAPDAILLDIKMPGMDGFETCRHLKNNEMTSHIPVIMLTAISTDSESKIRGLETGADAFLAKPIDEYVLIAQVKTALRIKRAEDKLRNEKYTLEDRVEDKTRKLEEAKNRYRIIFDNASDAIFLSGMDGWFLEVNKEVCKRLGYSREELLQMRISDIEDELSTAKIPERINMLQEAGSAFFESIHVAKDNTRINVEINSTLTNYKGEACVLSIARDITERNRIEEEKNRIRSHAQQVQKMEAIGTLAGGIAHDFNNILYPIIGYAEMVRDDLPDGVDKDNMNEILIAAKRAGELVKQILTFSRQTELERKPIQLQPIVKEAMKLIRSSLPTTIDIRHHIAPECSPVLGDPIQMHQIVMNLCTNAYHSMRDTGGTLEVSLSEMSSTEGGFQAWPGMVHGSYLILNVKDTGVGIPPEVQSRIFDPFFTTKGPGQGTGLGLSTIHGIVTKCSGHISVNSNVGEGSEFNVYFPVVKRSGKEFVGSDGKLTPTGTEHILLVDDEEQIVSLEKNVLERLGYRVTAFRSSPDALSVFSASPEEYDLVITDMTMPIMTGDTLAQRIKDIRPDIPVILLTGYSEIIDTEKCEHIGITDLVMKPVAKSDMAVAVREAIDKNLAGY